MQEIPSNDESIHINNTFTELFHLLTINCEFESNFFAKKLHVMEHAENGITAILHGLQAIGNLIATSSPHDKQDIIHLGHFLTLIANLMEALNVLRADCEYRLHENNRIEDFKLG